MQEINMDNNSTVALFDGKTIASKDSKSVANCI